MPEATFRHGNPTMIDHTPVAAVAAGEVVLVGSLALICHTPIAAGKLGALACGGGVYEATSLESTANGTKVYWDDTVNKATTVVGTNKQLGWIVESGLGGANSKAWVYHWPFV